MLSRYVEDVEINLSEFNIDFDIIEFEKSDGYNKELRKFKKNKQVDINDITDDDFDVSSQFDIKTKIKTGDVIQIGRHRLVCGDSTNESHLSLLFQDKLADLVLTDPPYNVDYEGKTSEKLKIDNDKMKDEAFLAFLTNAFTSLNNHVKKGGGWYIWHADSEGLNFRSAMKNAGVLMKQCLIWSKNQLVIGRQDYQWQHEPCLYGWKPGASHNWYSDRSQTTILKFDKPLRNGEHPTMKPVPLFAYLINNSSSLNDIVADTFIGSGTTMVSSHELDRICYAMDVSPIYCQVVVNRMKALDPTLDILINNSKLIT